MNALRSLAVEQQVALLFVILFGLLAAASIAVFMPTLRAQHSEQAEQDQEQQRHLLFHAQRAQRVHGTTLHAARSGTSALERPCALM